MKRPLLPHRIPGRPDLYYVKASGGYYLHDHNGFVALFGTRRDLARHLGVPTRGHPMTRALYTGAVASAALFVASAVHTAYVLTGGHI